MVRKTSYKLRHPETGDNWEIPAEVAAYYPERVDRMLQAGYEYVDEVPADETEAPKKKPGRPRKTKEPYIDPDGILIGE